MAKKVWTAEARAAFAEKMAKYRGKRKKRAKPATPKIVRKKPRPGRGKNPNHKAHAIYIGKSEGKMRKALIAYTANDAIQMAKAWAKAHPGYYVKVVSE